MKIKIVIVGLGGVGGYYGGMLAKRYAEDPEVDIHFLARGQHLKEVQRNGLKLITETGTFIVKPTLATDEAEEIGIADYVILTTKSYDLDATILQIKSCVDNQTVILPLLNGIDNSIRIRQLLPNIEVWSGCAYIVARLNEPGVVESSGNVHILNFGYENKTTERLLKFEEILKSAEIDARFHADIHNVIWTKFFFISSTASLTSYFDVSFGALLTDDERKSTLIKLLEELLLIAGAEGAKIDKKVIDITVKRLELLPFETTASMHSDFQAGKSTEVETLTGIVIRLAAKHGIEVPTYKKVYTTLTQKAQK